MAKKKSELSARERRIAKVTKPIPEDHEIDYSDVPKLTEEELKQFRRVGRPKALHVKLAISIRVDQKVLDALRRLAEKQNKPYQTLINEILTKAAKKAA